jgi:hypothetical protein
VVGGAGQFVRRTAHPPPRRGNGDDASVDSGEGRQAPTPKSRKMASEEGEEGSGALGR